MKCYLEKGGVVVNIYDFRLLVLDETNSDDYILKSLAGLEVKIGGCVAKKISSNIVIKMIKKHRPHLQTILEMACILTCMAKSKAISDGVKPIFYSK